MSDAAWSFTIALVAFAALGLGVFLGIGIEYGSGGMR